MRSLVKSCQITVENLDAFNNCWVLVLGSLAKPIHRSTKKVQT